MTQRLPSSADALLRINFAAQAAVLMATTLGSTASKSDDREADKVLDRGCLFKSDLLAN